MSCGKLFLSLCKCACAFALLAFSAGVSQAAIITYGPTPSGTFAVGASGGFSIPQFNSSLGTLTQVDLYVTGNSAGGSNGLQNLSGNTGTASVSIGTNITVSGPAALTVLTLPASTNSGSVGPYGGALDFTFSGPDSILVNGAPSTDSQSASITSGLAPYIGLGTVSFSYSSTANTSSSASVSPTFSSTTPPSFDFSRTVVYTYIPASAPEPSTLVLGGMGLVGLLGLARSRRRIA